MKDYVIKNKIVIFFLLFNLLSVIMKAQINEGGTPVSFSLEFDTQAIPILVMPSFNLDSIIQEEARLDREGIGRPFRFGYAHSVDIDLKKSAMLKQLTNGDKLYILKIHSKNAYSINLIYNYYKLSKDSKFFVYNEDRSMILGAFTSDISNSKDNVFATDLVEGNTITLEYYEPKYSDDGIINISKVVHGYINTFANFSNGYGGSESCNIDINCSLGNNLENEKKAVSMILVDDNSAFCTGCLINNTLQNGIPYYLTANHCYFDEHGNLRYNPATNIFRFKYWRPNCNSGYPSNWVSITGATIRANYSYTDFILLELNSVPPANYNVYYAGWDRTSMPAQNSTGIHHPSGDAMKISYTSNPAVAVVWNGITQTHWRVNFTQGTVEIGSSGSPLFNQSKKIVGQLQGNSYWNPFIPYCDQRQVEYGRFDISWTGGGTNSTRLSNWLDPIGTGTMVLDGACFSTLVTGTQPPSPTTYKFIDCNEIIMQDAIVPTGTTLELEASQSVIINPSFTVQSGASFIVR